MKVLALAALIGAATILLFGCGSSTSSTTNDTGAGAATWTKVISVKGDGDKTSKVFNLTGGDLKLVWKFSGDPDFSLLTAYVESEGYDLEQGGGLPVLNPHTTPGKGTVTFERDAGPHVVIVNSANCRWTISILEKK